MKNPAQRKKNTLKANLIKINSITTLGKGSLAFFEAERDIPFEIRRIYFIYDTLKSIQRGGHAHKELQQLLFCPYGAISIDLDDGFEKMSVELDDPSKGLLLSGNIWHEMTWNVDNSVLLVAASSYYDESDYIRNYSDFIKYVKENN